MAASVESSRHEAACALEHGKRFGVEGAEKSEVKIARPAKRDGRYNFKCRNLLGDARDQPRTRTSLKLTSTRPPACGRPKLNCGRKRENSIT
jgi:hypothetical protein